MPYGPTPKNLPGATCAQCGSSEMVRCGRLVTGEQRWTCGPCKRTRNREYARHRAADQRAHQQRYRAWLAGHPMLVAHECGCGDRLGDNPWCLEHENVEIAG